MEGCSKTSASAVPGLPDDPLVEILSRVPAKSVCRFKCVSKAWRDLIADPGNRKKLRQPMQGLFVRTFEFPEFEINKVVRISISMSFLDLTVRSVPLDIDPCFSFVTEMTGVQAFLVDSCNGLILLRLDRHRDGYIMCNPTTRQWSAVAACGTEEMLDSIYLAFDPAISSHFHLLEFQMPRWKQNVVALHIYSSETGTWSQNQIVEQKEQGQLEGWHHQFSLDTTTSQRAFVNGFLHLMVCGLNVKHILAVDVQGKATRMITVPGMADGRHVNGFIRYLGQSQGCLHCVIEEKSHKKISIWVLQDYDAQEWMLKNTVNSLDVFGEKGFLTQFEMVEIHQDSNVVFLFNTRSFELIAYNLDRKEVSVIATFEVRKVIPQFARYVPYFSESPALTNKY